MFGRIIILLDICITSNQQTMFPKEDASRLKLLSAQKIDSIILNNFIDYDAIGRVAFTCKADSIIEITIIL